MEILKEEYETPRASVRGVFLCEDLADTLVSARGSIRQEDWDISDDQEVGAGTNTQGNINIFI
jgi:hypothetical protein